MNQTTMQRIPGTLRLPKHRAPVNPEATQKQVDLTQPSHGNEAVMPHERDEQVGMTGGVASPMVEQAARDLKRGIKDTSRSVEADAAYKKLKSA
jgi:hypothetical protein